MDLFIEEYLNGYYLRETTKEQYESNLLDENHDVVKLQMRDVIDVSDFDNPPHPLKQVVRLVDYSQSWENGSSWALVFQFNHKGKYYIYELWGRLKMRKAEIEKGKNT